MDNIKLIKSDAKLMNLIARVDCNNAVGTAFLIDNSTLLTAYHVVKKHSEVNDRVKIFFNQMSETYKEASVISISEENDVAILKLSECISEKEFLKINSSQIYEGMEWRSYTCFDGFDGTENQFEKKLIKGKIFQNEEFNKEKYDISLDGEYLKSDWIGNFEGCSGSPLVIDGYISGIIVKEENSAIKSPLKAVSIYKMKEYLKEKNINIKDFNVSINRQNNVNNAAKKIYYIPIATSDEFYGRADKIQEINELFKTENIVVVKGMAGVGKTQLAIQYANIYKTMYDLVFFIGADTKENILNDYLNLAKHLEIYKEEMDITTIIRNTITYLSNKNNWIIIFDNAINYQIINEFIPNYFDGKIIITTKNSTWIKYKPIELEVFDEDEAPKFLMKITEQDDEENSKILTNLLGRLPLAIVQAAAYMNITCMSLENYIELYKQYKLDLFDESYIPEEYNQEMKIVWKISLDKIKTNCMLSIKIISFLSFFASNSIPVESLNENLDIMSKLLEDNINIISYNKAIKILREYSLININKKYVSVHCLVQISVQNELVEINETQKYIKAGAKFLNILLPDCIEETYKWENSLDLIPHAYSIVQNIEEHKIEEQEIIDLLYKVALILRVYIQLDEAANKIDQCMEMAKNYYSYEDMKIFKIMNLYAGIMRDKGEIDIAEVKYEECIKNIEKQSDPEFKINLAVVKNNLGLIKSLKGRYYEAIKLFEDSIEISNIDNDFSRASKGTTLGNLSIEYCNIDENEKALKTINEAIENTKEELGDNNINYSRCINNLAHIFSHQKMYAEAKKKYEEAIRIDEEFYGEEHPEVAKKKSSLATCLIKLNDLDNAEELINNSIRINNLVYGEKSIQNNNNLNSLGIIFIERNKIDKAIEKYEEAINITKDSLGEVHPSVSRYVYNLAVAIEKKGDLDKAIEKYEESLSIDKEIYGKKHQYVGQILQDIAEVLYKKENYKKARSYAMKSKHINEGKYGKQSIEVAKNLVLLGMISYKTYIYDKAFQYYSDALNIHNEYYHEDNETIALDYNNMAMSIYELEGIGKAKEYILKANRIATNNLEISRDNFEIIKNNYKLIMNAEEYNILEELKRYEIEFIEKGNTLIIKTHKKLNK